MKAWRIEGYDGLNRIFDGTMPGHMSESEILTTLQRLVARHLSVEEVISASLRRGAKGRSELLDRIGSGAPIHCGENPYYTASYRDLPDA